MCSRTFASLVGCVISGSVGEPWDFESEVGPNALSGSIESVSGSGSSVQWLLCRVKSFMHSGRTIEHLVAVLRYRKTETFEDFCAGKRIGVNLVFDPGGEPTCEDDISRLLTTPGFPFLAGSIQIG